MGICLAHNKKKYDYFNSYIIMAFKFVKLVFDENFKNKSTKPFKRKREEDRIEQVKDSSREFIVLFRAKTNKKKISTYVI
jgi:hypothetical protein